VHVHLPARSAIRPEHLAVYTRDAEEEIREKDGIEVRIWVDNYFVEPGATVIG
jgi:hypothetical protein